MIVFDRALLRRRRDRAAPRLAAHDFLYLDAADRLVDRLEDMDRSFDRALDLGCHGGEIGRALEAAGKVGWLAQSDLSPAMVAQAPSTQSRARVSLDEERLPFVAGAFDLVVSGLSLHWVNDLPGTLVQILRTLKPDGLFLATLFGGETLIELRTALMDAELSVSGGASPRISPFVDVRDAGMLMQRAGFTLPVVDADTVTVTYADPLALMRDVTGMGEANALANRNKTPLRRAVLERMIELYSERHTTEDGRISASFQFVTLTGWKPHASQQQPLKPGSAAQRLADALHAVEMPAGEAAPGSNRK